MSVSSLIAELRSVLREEQVICHDGGLVPFESDGLTAFSVRPQAVLVPESEAEVQQIIKACARWNVPFVVLIKQLSCEDLKSCLVKKHNA